MGKHRSVSPMVGGPLHGRLSGIEEWTGSFVAR